MIRFIPPNTCPHCEQRDVQPGKRTTIVLDHQLLCGYCGTQFASIPCEDPPAPVGAFMRTLVEHGLFHMEPTSPYNPLTLWANDNNGSPVVICRICYSTTQSNTSQIPPQRACKLETLPSSLPDTVRQGIKLVTQLRFERGVRLSMTMTDLCSDRKTIRFEVVKEQRSSGQYKFSADITRIEFSWTEPSFVANLYIPLYGSQSALEFLRTARSDWNPSKLQLCFNFYTGQSAARDNGHHHAEAEELFLINVRCNPLVIGAALILDGFLRVGGGQRYESLADWWSRVSTQTSWSNIGPNVIETFKKDSTIGFSLESVGPNPHYKPDGSK